MVYCSAGPTKLRRQSIATSAQPRFAGLPDQLSRELAALLVPVHDRHDLGLHKAVDHVAYGSMSFDIAGSMTAPRMAASSYALVERGTSLIVMARAAGATIGST